MTRERYQIKEGNGFQMEAHCYDTMCLFFPGVSKKWSGGPFFTLLGEQRRFSKEGEEIK